MDGGTAATGARRPARRDHRARRPQDDDQRAQLRRARVHGRLRGCVLADVGERRRRPKKPDRRRAPHDLARHAGEELPACGRDRDARRPSTRLAPRRASRRRRRSTRVGEPLRLRARGVPQRARATRARRWSLLLLAEAREPPRGAALERRLRARGARARPASRLDPRDGADRDDPRRVRDGRDPVGAARPLGRAQRRSLGLHLQRDQEARRGSARSRAGDDDGAVHARVHGAARLDVPPSRRARDRRHGGVHSLTSRSPR